MKLLNCASVIATLAILSLPTTVAVEAAESAKAMLKDPKGQDVGPFRSSKPPPEYSFGFRSKTCPRESTPFTSTLWASASRLASIRQAGISIRPARTTV